MSHLALRGTVPGPHGDAAIRTRGVPAARARAAMIMLHGRGAGPEEMLALADALDAPQTFVVAPQAAESTWYPQRFLAPLQDNEPFLSSALAVVGAIVDQLSREGLPPERQVLLGFSQGGCLALEFAGRNAGRYGGVVGLSAGLIGPPGRHWNFTGSLDATPILLGCSDNDPHIPRDRLEESARELARIGGDVELMVYPGLGHTVNQDELDRIQKILEGVP